MNSSLLVEMRGGVQFTMRGFKIQWQKIDPGVKIPYGKWTRGQNIIGKSTPGSIYHGVQNTIWHRARKDYLKNNYLTLMSKVKVPHRSLRYVTHRLMVMHPHTKYHWPVQASTLTYFSTCPFGQLTIKSTCPTQSFSCPKKDFFFTKTRE